MMKVTAVARAPIPFSNALSLHRLLRSRRQCITIPVCESVHAKNTDLILVLILACLNTNRARRLTDEWAWLEEHANWASVFPAAQNLLLAARALGLGTAISIFPLFRIEELRQVLKLPDYMKPGILIYVGYPVGRFSEAKRLPIASFIHQNVWRAITP